MAQQKPARPGDVGGEAAMAIQPIFLFSVSRSGSTLTQRVIAAHDGVATAAEPWLLLPYAYALREQGISAEYFHPLMVTAIEDFCRQLPAGVDDYRREMRAFALRLYEKASDGTARYFLDKSPSYYLVAEEIMSLFPEGKFVFLWRNPLSIMASIIETFSASRWYPSLFRGDLFIGLPRLIASFGANRARAHAVRFENLTGGGQAHWRRLMEYLEIEFEPGALERFSQVRLDGRMGDPTGTTRYSALSHEPAEKWKKTLANPTRKALCRRYLRFLGPERLALMGYDLAGLMAELDALPTTLASLAPDLGRLALDVAREPVRVRVREQGVGGPSVIRELLRV
jgi:Sulfotransferase family